MKIKTIKKLKTVISPSQTFVYFISLLFTLTVTVNMFEVGIDNVWMDRSPGLE